MKSQIVSGSIEDAQVADVGAEVTGSGSAAVTGLLSAAALPAVRFLRNMQRWLSFAGPAWLVSAAYIDPGSIVSDFQQGAYTGYQMLWVLFLATLVGCLFQNMSVRLGLVTGKNLAALCAEYYEDKHVNWTVWLLMEISTVLVDVQAVVGSAVAVSALVHVPFWASCLIICVLTVVVVVLYQLSGNKTEIFAGVLVIGLVVCFAVPFLQESPPAGDVFFGWLVPTAQPYTLFTGLGILGALMMPNVIFLHSDLVIQHKYDAAASKVTVYWSCFVEMMTSMMLAFFGNLVIICVFAVLFFNQQCAEQGLAMDQGSCATVLLDDGLSYLGKRGVIFKGFFLAGLIGSGLASMISSTLAGQCITEGFLKIRLPFWQRLLITRAITLIPTLLLSILPGSGSNTASILNEWINVIVSILLPFAIIPVVHFSYKDFMAGWKLHWLLQVLAWALTAAIIGINFYFLVGFIYQPQVFGTSAGSYPRKPWFYSLVGAGLVVYFYLLFITLRESLVESKNFCVETCRALLHKYRHRLGRCNLTTTSTSSSSSIGSSGCAECQPDDPDVELTQ